MKKWIGFLLVFVLLMCLSTVAAAEAPAPQPDGSTVLSMNILDSIGITHADAVLVVSALRAQHDGIVTGSEHAAIVMTFERGGRIGVNWSAANVRSRARPDFTLLC